MPKKTTSTPKPTKIPKGKGGWPSKKPGQPSGGGRDDNPARK